MIRPDAPPGYEIYIGHLSRVDVAWNASIEQGATVLGLSGSANGVNHIHFEVRRYGKQTDTMGWYGSGADPCDELIAQGAYGGCEASNWLWVDENPPSTEPPNFTRFSDTFSDGNFDGWTIVDAPGAISGPSAWAVVHAKGGLVLRQDSNIHIQTPPPYDGTYVYTGQSDWTDYHLTVDFEPDDNDGVFVLFRYVDDDNFYRFIMDHERKYRRLEKKINGNYTTLAEDLVTGYETEWNNVYISVEAEEITVLLNYTPIFTVTDNSLSAGMIGLGTWASTDCHFDNVIVARADIVDPYADAVADASIKTGGNGHSSTLQALGRANGNLDSGYVSIGGPGYWVVLDMGEGEEITDGLGNDLRIFEIGAIFGGVDEEYDVFIGNSSSGPWKYLGQGWTTSEFDLAGSGLTSARYVLIMDLSTRTGNPKPGSDIDAVYALNMADDVIISAPDTVAMSISNNDVLLNWSPVANAVGYNIYASRLGGGVGFSNIDFISATVFGASTDIVATTSLSYTHQNAADDNFFYAITAINPKGFESSLSSELPYSSEIFLPIIIKSD